MATCTDYCIDDPLGEYEEVSCGDFPAGGLPAMILLGCNHQLNATTILSKVAVGAEITAGRAWKVLACSLDIQNPTPITRESSSPCDDTPILLGYNWKGAYDNDNISQGNISFHNQLFDGRRFGGMLLQECTEPDADHFMSWINATITFRGGRTIGKKKVDGQKFTGEYSWSSLASAQRYPEPAGLFE